MRLINSEERDYVGYSNNPPMVEWPGGARLAVSICVNYEEGSEQSIYFGDRNDEPLSEWGSTLHLPAGERNRTSESFTEYGSRVGFWRLIELFDRYNVKVTFFACAQALERNPAAAQAIVEHGHEVCSHGYRWENHYGMSHEEERQRIQEAVNSLVRTTGVRPVGWYSREGLTSNTRSILSDEDFLYDSNSYADDIPYFVEVAGRPHLIVPYSGDVNDIRYWLSPGFVTGEQYLSVLRASFDSLLAEAQRVPRIMSVGLHLRISGRPSRIGAVQGFLEHVSFNNAVWVTRRDEIARWWVDHVRTT
jgi:peptidoglycan/xylan/chitin deacetylase (PgdA/CDA1 family)